MTSDYPDRRLRFAALFGALLLSVATSRSARAQHRPELGDWALQGAGASRAILHLRDEDPQLVERDTAGVHTYPVTVTTRAGEMLLVIPRAAGPDSLTARPYGHRTLFVERHRGRAPAKPLIFARLAPAAMTRYEAELRADTIRRP